MSKVAEAIELELKDGGNLVKVIAAGVGLLTAVLAYKVTSDAAKTKEGQENANQK